MNVENIKKDFPLLENRNITYLDSGATTQKPIQVINAIEKFYGILIVVRFVGKGRVGGFDTY